jgi:hypothetical protein
MLNNILKHKLKTCLKYVWKYVEPTFRPTRVQPHILPHNQSPSPPKHFIFPFRKIVAHILVFYFPLPENLKNTQKDQTKSKSQKTVRALSNVNKGCVREGIDIPGNHEHSLSPSTTLPPYSPPPFPHPPSPPGRGVGWVWVWLWVVGLGLGRGGEGGWVEGGRGGWGEGEKYDL